MSLTYDTRIGLLLFPKLTQLDFTAPFELLSKVPDARVYAVARQRGAVSSDCGLALVADTDFDGCPDLDVLFVPGGPGVNDVLQDAPTMAFVRRQGQGAGLVTSVCTGSLVLAAAGLLDGYRAGCHWASRELLACFGVQADAARVVVDRNRITGGGVTAGLDFGLSVIAALRGEDLARRLQLMLEYDPKPPFDSGSPATAAPALVQGMRAAMAPMLAQRREACEAAARRLRG